MFSSSHLCLNYKQEITRWSVATWTTSSGLINIQQEVKLKAINFRLCQNYIMFVSRLLDSNFILIQTYVFYDFLLQQSNATKQKAYAHRRLNLYDLLFVNKNKQPIAIAFAKNFTNQQLFLNKHKTFVTCFMLNYVFTILNKQINKCIRTYI